MKAGVNLSAGARSEWAREIGITVILSVVNHIHAPDAGSAFYRASLGLRMASR